MNHPVCCIRPQCDVCLDPSRSFNMVSVSMIKLYCITAVIAAAVGLYFVAAQIDELARDKYMTMKPTNAVADRSLLTAGLMSQEPRRNPFSSRVLSKYHRKVETVVIDAQVNRTYQEQVNSNVEYIFQYSYQQSLESSQAVAVQTTSLAAGRENPVLIVVRQPKAVQSWQLPMLIDTVSGMQKYSRVSRTLCSEPVRGENDTNLEQEFFIGVSTSDKEDLSFSLSVTLVDHFVINLDHNYSTVISASEPKYFQFLFPEGVSNILLKVHSDDSSCMSLSVQNLSCPVYDEESLLKYEGSWQTLMNQSGMTISRNRFPDGFFIVFAMKADDYECTGRRTLPPSYRRKSVYFSLHEKVSYIKFMFAVLGVLGVFVLFYVVAFVTFCFHCSDDLPDELTPSLLEAQHHRGSAGCTAYGSTISSDSTVPPNTPELPTELSSSLDLADVDLLPDAFVDKEVIRTKTFLFVADLSHKGPRFHGKKSALYMWNLLIVAIFYALPVVQLVIIYQKVLNDTGDQDVCYFNFLCAHPLGPLTDFNHVYSNIGYVLLGLLFIINTARRDVIRRRAQGRQDRLEKYYGIPQHFGLFYAMGTALMVEGILSASYHICPTHANYQFDTTFMYVISILCVLKIYQTRHPDINAEAHSTFAFLAFIVLLGVVSVFEDGLPFRILFAIFHLLACLLLCAHIYYMGRWRLDLGVFKRIYLVCWNDFYAGPAYWFRPMYVDRMLLLIFGFLFNLGVEIYVFLEWPMDFATFILVIFITNLLLYTTFYIIMKLRSGERITLQPFLYIVLALACWAPAIYFFIHNAVTWKKRAAESRTMNQECIVLSIYDYHDIWHFLSAASLFFSFMTLLTLDDDLRFTPRDRIPVF